MNKERKEYFVCKKTILPEKYVLHGRQVLGKIWERWFESLTGGKNWTAIGRRGL